MNLIKFQVLNIIFEIKWFIKKMMVKDLFFRIIIWFVLRFVPIFSQQEQEAEDAAFARALAESEREARRPRNTVSLTTY